ncbi:MAG: class I SAM-dependent methyltransferase [Promethearchaeota archaeon]
MGFNLDNIRMTFLKYTRMAYKLLPKINNPKILDVGCGSGIPTLELAKLSNGNIIGIDIDKSSLEKFKKKMNQSEFNYKISIKQMSLLDNDFPDENFDIIWSEGAFSIIGFKKAIKICHRLLKKGKFLVIFEAVNGVEYNMELINSTGFKLVDKILLPDDIWITNYFEPIKEMIKEINYKELTPDQVKELKKAKKDLHWVKNATPKELESAFYTFMRI